MPELAHRLKALVALGEDPGLVSSTHMARHNHLSVTLVPGTQHSPLTCGTSHACDAQTLMQAKTRAVKKKKKKAGPGTA